MLELARFKEWAKCTNPTKLKVKSFQKKESYQTLNDPSNISTLPTDHTVELLRYTLAFSKVVLKQRHTKTPLHWYMPGRSPTEISNTLMEFRQLHRSILVVDYSGLDGTISKFLRHLELNIYYRHPIGGFVHPVRQKNRSKNTKLSETLPNTGD